MDSFHISIIVSILLVVCGSTQPITITIGAIFEEQELGSQNAFKLAIEFANENDISGSSIHFDYVLNTTKLANPFDPLQLICYQASRSVAGFIGPLGSTAVGAVVPLTDHLRLPLMAPVATNPMLDAGVFHPYLFRMSSPDTVQSLAIADLIAYFGWRHFAILTSDTEYGSHGLTRLASEATRRRWTLVSSQQFHVRSNISEIEVGLQLSLIKDRDVRIIVLHCEGAYLAHVIQQAEERNMTSSGWAWVVTDSITTTMENPPASMLGMIGTRPTLGRGKLLDEALAWARRSSKYSPLIKKLDAFQSYTIAATLTFIRAISELHRESKVTTFPLDCLQENSWSQGERLREIISQLKQDGVSGNPPLFTASQAPVEVIYDYVNLHSVGWKKIGEWTTERGLEVTSPQQIWLAGHQRSVIDHQSRLAGRTLRVVTIEEPPFVIIKKPKYSHTSYLPREEVSGLCMDLLDLLAKRIGFKYKLYLVRDGKFGGKEPATGNWNGMVSDLVDRVADMAAAPMTINYIRETDIDFTRPYFDIGVGIIIKKPPPEKWDPFKFTRPFSAELWYYILGTTLIVGIYVTLLNRLSPYDVHGHFVYKDEPGQITSVNEYRQYKIFKRAKIEATYELNLGNGLWLSVASLLHQGGEHYPRAFSSRISLLVWWLGVMILIATYTANLAAHLTSNRVYEEIRSAEDLANQNKILYGTVADSAPLQFLNSSRVELYTDMLNFMREKKTLVSSSKDGIERVYKGGFAFLWDSAILDFAKQQEPCGVLRSVGRPFGKTGYGFGLQKNSPYNKELSQRILALRENGVIDEFVKKWYVKRNQCPPPDSSENSVPDGRLNVMHTTGEDNGFFFMKLGFQDKIQESESDVHPRCASSGRKDGAGGEHGFEGVFLPIKLFSNVLFLKRAKHVTIYYGVFLIIWCGCGAGFLILIVEWVVACSSSVDPTDPNKPQNFRESFWLRWNKSKTDVCQMFNPALRNDFDSSTVIENLQNENKLKDSKSSSVKKGLSDRMFNNRFGKIKSTNVPISPVHLPNGQLVCRDLNNLRHLTGRHSTPYQRP